ncbi:MAG: hypothetical protein ACKN9R_05365 [Candidatus Limnocylindrus sp.]
MNTYHLLGAVLMCGQILTCFLVVAAFPRLAAAGAWRAAFAGICLTMATAIWMMRSLS